jgi:hypothetical protein
MKRSLLKPAAILGMVALLLLTLCMGWLYLRHGLYGFNVLLRRGGSYWVAVEPESPRISASMRLALRDPPPEFQAGPLEWHSAAAGFDVAELPVLVAGEEVDRVLLARVDPARFRFLVRTAPAGNKGPDEWMTELGAALVINGSYYAGDGRPDTPLVSAGALLGPSDYDARHGAFVASDDAVGIRDLAAVDWRSALTGAQDAMVSYSLLLAADGSARVNADRRWLANRSFVGEDNAGRIVLGTTRDAFFSLESLARFLRTTPLDLRTALNLDGGPVACQYIAIGSARRSACGQWETSVRDGQLHLLTWGYGNWSLPIVLAVVPR